MLGKVEQSGTVVLGGNAVMRLTNEIVNQFGYPPVICYTAMGKFNNHLLNGKDHDIWPFSIAMLNVQHLPAFIHMNHHI